MNTRRSQLLFFFFLMAMPFACIEGQQKHFITPQDLAAVRAVSNPRISPDGQWVAFEVSEPTPAGKASVSRNIDIWLVSTDGKSRPVRFTNAPSREYAPAWSPDGNYLAYLSDKGRDKKNRIFLQPRDSKEGSPIAGFDLNVEMFQWVSDSVLAFVAKDIVTKESVSDAVIVGREKTNSHLWEINLITKKIRRLTRKNEHVVAFDYSPDRKKVAIRISPTSREDDITFHSRLIILNRYSLGRKTLGGADKGFTLDHCHGTPHWSPDGKMIASFVTVKVTYLPVIFSAGDGRGKILANTYRGAIWYMDWDPVSGNLLFSSNEGVQGIFGKISPVTGKITVIRKVNRSFSEAPNWSTSSDGHWIAFQDAAFNNPDDVWIMHPDGSGVRQLTEMNPHFQDLLFGEQKVIRWKSFDGREIEGILILPVHYDPGKKYPLVVQIHGGPLWAWWNGCLANWHEWAQLLATHGFAVLYPNPRGSNGYGWRFALENIGDWGGGDFQDILSGIDHLIHRGIADPKRIGIGGWSYGGFMTAWAVTHSQRFKAAVMGASVTDLKTMYSTSGRPENFSTYMGGPPYGETEKIYTSHSPVTFVEQVTTPTLVLHGGEDPVVPITQSKEFYQGLLDHKVITEFVIYPRESHGISGRNHQIDLMQRVVEWFLHYMQ